MGQQAVVVEQFLDVSCPWSHGTLETNQRVLDELAADPDVPALELQWRFMRLHPMPRPEGLTVDEYYASRGMDAEGCEAARQGVRDYVRSVGVRVDFARYSYVHDPFTAHRLLAAVRDDEGHDVPSLWSVARAVFSANFVHGLDITDLAALRGAVERTGLAIPSRVWELVAAEDGHGHAPRRDHERALEVGLDGVPRMVVGGRIVPTWVDPLEVRSTLREAIAAAAAGSPSPTPA